MSAIDEIGGRRLALLNSPLPATPELAPIVDSDDVGFVVSVSTEDGIRVVRLVGELDMAARNRLLRACLAGHHNGVIVDMSELTFLDCGGYGALVAIRQVLAEGGESLTLRNHSGEPARLLARFEPALLN